jgi:hypothetical protein
MVYDQIVNFLDDMEPIEIPEEFQSILDETEKYLDDEKIQEMSANIQNAYNDFDTYWKNNKDTIIQYAEFKKSNEYRNSVVPQLMGLFHKFGETSGYYDVFIPLMRKLSPEYDIYYKKMLEANEQLIQKMPDIKNWYEPTK